MAVKDPNTPVKPVPADADPALLQLETALPSAVAKPTEAASSGYTPLVDQMVASDTPTKFRDEQVATNQEYLNSHPEILDQSYAQSLTSGVVLPEGEIDRSNNPKGQTNGDNARLSDKAWWAIYGAGGYEEQWNALQAEKATATPERRAEIEKEQDVLHAKAETLRYHSGGIGAGHLGGVDGSMHLGNPLFDTGAEDASGYGSGSAFGTASTGNAQASQGAGNIPSVDQAKANQQTMLEQLKQAMVDQATGQIDYNVAKAITELERALEDAQPQYKEQQEQIARDEMQSRDNAALYAEARGDKGGIGQEQYSSIMNTAAQNRLAVQQAQTKLSTDTQRQIADLRAQGEFEKADALLEISQQYLSQLLSLEQWAFDAGLSVAQFQESIRQWQAEFNDSVRQFNVSADQWQQSFDYQKEQDSIANNQWQQQFDYAKDQDGIANNQWQQQFDYQKEQDAINRTQSQLVSTGEALLAAGIMPSASQLAAMGMTQTQAQSYIEAAKLAAQSGSGSVTGSGSDPEISLPSTKDQVYKDAKVMLDNGASDEAVYNYLASVSPENADTYAGFLQIEIPEKSEPSGNSVNGYNLKSEDAKLIHAKMMIGGITYDDMMNQLIDADITNEEFDYLMDLLGRIFYIVE